MKELEVQGMSFRYPKGKEPVFENVSFHADAGKVTVLIGPNGAGKTTMLKSILGIHRAAGDVFLFGKPKKDYSPREFSSMVSYLTQESTYLSSLSVFEMVLLGKVQTLGIRVSDEALQAVWETLKSLRLEPLSDTPYYALSGGQRKIVNLAQAIVKSPSVLVLDEPTANLDMKNELEVMALIQAYTRSRNVTTLMTLHDLSIAGQFADQIILLKGKHIFAQGTPSQVIREDIIRSAYEVEAEVIQNEDGIPFIGRKKPVQEKSWNF